MVRSTPDLAVLRAPGILVTFERIENHVPPTWPGGQTPKQLHLDLAVDDLNAEVARIIALGASESDVQPDPDNWRVLIGPAGHPFCITVMFPATA